MNGIFQLIDWLIQSLILPQNTHPLVLLTHWCYSPIDMEEPGGHLSLIRKNHTSCRFLVFFQLQSRQMTVVLRLRQPFHEFSFNCKSAAPSKIGTGAAFRMTIKYSKSSPAGKTCFSVGYSSLLQFAGQKFSAAGDWRTAAVRWSRPRTGTPARWDRMSARCGPLFWGPRRSGRARRIRRVLRGKCRVGWRCCRWWRWRSPVGQREVCRAAALSSQLTCRRTLETVADSWLVIPTGKRNVSPTKSSSCFVTVMAALDGRFAISTLVWILLISVEKSTKWANLSPKILIKKYKTLKIQLGESRKKDLYRYLSMFKKTHLASIDWLID